MAELIVNGQRRSVKADDQMPLLWVLRDLLGLTGTKFGCGKGLCGACTVHLNGAPIRSCSFPVSGVADGKITTIEGLKNSDSEKIRTTWQALNVPQCGYCQPGQIMSATALLAAKKSPSDRDIDEAMGGNICRCGTYQRIKAAIKKAAKRKRSPA